MVAPMVDRTGGLHQGAQHVARNMVVAILAKAVSIEKYSILTRGTKVQQSRN